jgi:hypothetical protein
MLNGGYQETPDNWIERRDESEGEHWCSECCRWDDECECFDDEENFEQNCTPAV